MKNILRIAFLLCSFIALKSNAQLPGNSLRILADYNYVSVPDASSNLLNNTMTIEAWVYYECINGAAGNMIMSKGWCSVPDYSFYFNIVGQRLRLKKIRNGTGGCSATGDPIWETNTDVIPFNTWVHVAMSIDATTSNTSLVFYVDGLAVPHSLISGVDGAGFNASPYPILIGSSRSISNVYSSISGNLDDIRIWHTIRTQAEIQANKDAELIGNEVGLYAYWKMNETGSGPGIVVANSATSTGITTNGSSVGTAANVSFIDNNLIPNTLPTCDPVLWLKADAGVTYNSNNEVSAWNDQSGLNNHATMSITANKPIYKTNEINNKPIVRFDGVNDYLVTPSINLSTVNKAEVFYVLKSRGEGYVIMHNNNPSAANAFSIVENFTNGTNGHSVILNGNGTDRATCKSQMTDSCYHTMNIQFDKSLLSLDQVKIYRNQSLLNNSNGTITGAEMTNNLSNAIMSIGGTSVGGNPFLNADIAEIIVYNKILTTYQRNTIYNYLNNKYFTNKVSTQFTSIPSTNINSNTISDDDVWRHSYNSSQPTEIISSIKSSCLTLDQRDDTVFVEPNAIPYAGSYFMRRHYVISPIVEFSGTKTLRLYYSAADFNDLQNVIPSLTSHNQLTVIQYDGLNEDGTYNPSGGTIHFISPTHGTLSGMYYLQFDVTHFSEFWIQVGSIPLPITDLHLSVVSDDNKHRLSWNCTGCNDITSFSVLESSDAISFNTKRMIQTNSNASEYQTFMSPSSSSKQYFAIETQDIDGHVYRSNVCATNNKNNINQLQVISSSQNIILYSTNTNTTIRVYNMQGQLVTSGQNRITINKDYFAPGLYVANLVELDAEPRSIKFAIY